MIEQTSPARNHPAKLEQGEDEEIVPYLTRQFDAWTTNPPAAPDGFSLIPCEATPRHWPMYEIVDDDFYGAHCLNCAAEEAYAAHEGCEHSHHRAWRRWKITHKIVTWLYASGLSVTGGSFKWGGGCNACLTSGPMFRRGRRPYVLFVQTDTWRCILKGHHLPGDPIGFGYCAKCLPCPDCGSKTAGHNDGCEALS